MRLVNFLRGLGLLMILFSIFKTNLNHIEILKG
jgi:hypothetical protein